MKKQPSKYWAIKNLADNTVEVKIYGEITPYAAIIKEWFGEDAVSVATFENEFTAATKDASKVLLRINSPGGDIAEGNAIINILNRSGKDITAVIDGVAYSMAGIIFMSQKNSVMYKNSMLHIHAPITGVYGNAKELRTTADILDQFAQTLSPIIADKTGLSEADVISKYMDGADHFFTAKQALELKLINKIEDAEASLPNVQNMHDIAAVQNAFMPSETNLFKSFIGGIAALVTGIKSEKKPTENMSLTKLKDALKAGKAINLTEADVTGLQQEVATHEQELETANANVIRITDELTTSQASLQEANEKITALQTKIDNAIANGNISVFKDKDDKGGGGNPNAKYRTTVDDEADKISKK